MNVYKFMYNEFKSEMTYDQNCNLNPKLQFKRFLTLFNSRFKYWRFI